MHPETIDQISDQALTIRWSDGHESIYFAPHLRKNCPCAQCEKQPDQDSPAVSFKIMGSDPEKVTFTSWSMIGRYAIQFSFSDGHTTGIYTYQTLRDLCQCDLCTGNVVKIQGPLR